uniref:Protein exportin 1A n=1 Tax=Tanacetum cinerariifolium TaxID=118510 RepID=A0A6L2NG99_TANCI|nr:protein exportin 1A [Tanacetum cinerariifolium]
MPINAQSFQKPRGKEWSNVSKHPYKEEYMRSVKRETLKLIETFLDKAKDQPQIIKQYVPLMTDLALGDYAPNVHDAKESRVISLFATIISKLTVKLLLEIRCLLQMNPTHERLFRDTVFGRWLDIQSHKNDSHLMHYVFQHQGEYMWVKFYKRNVNVVAIHTAHHLAEIKKNPSFNATYNLYGFDWEFKLPKPSVALISTSKEMTQAWFRASVEFIKDLADHDGGHLKDVNFVEGLDETVDPNSNLVLVEEKDGVLDSDPSSFCSHPANKDIASHCDDHMENDMENKAEKSKDDYNNSQHHLDLLIKVCAFKAKNPTIDVVVPPNGDDRLLHTLKHNNACDEVDVDHFENDEEQPVKSSLDEMELEEQPVNLVDKQGNLEQQPNDSKDKSTILKENEEVKVDEKPCVETDLAPPKVKKKKCQQALRRNHVLRSAHLRKKKLGMALKPPFGQ